jgi:predicted PurR-regulated permease PerM
MTARQQILFWLGGLVLFGLIVYLLRPILLPFVAGMAVAYLLDPAADRLERWRLSRHAATWILTVSFFLLLVLVVLLIAPVLYGQIVGFIDRLPEYIQAARDWLTPALERVRERFPMVGDPNTLWQGTPGITQNALGWMGSALARVWNGGLALFNVVSLLLITPVVAYYLLRDWDRFTAYIDSMLPREHADVIREQARRIDSVMAAFVRGQALVALADGIVYATGLSIVGLEFGLAIGLGAGFLSFVPFLGPAVGGLTAILVALLQWGFDPTKLGLVVGVFVVGQLLENAVWQPRLLGGQVGLHPVWIIFSVMAGGAMFGFVGVLISVPMAAAVGVLLRFAFDRYRHSRIYLGAGPPQ